MRQKIVMLLLVRDEADILAANIWFHVRHGVDFFVIMDNGSTDGSREIAADFVPLGLACLIDEPEHTNKQGEWVTRMAHIARDRFGADWVIPNDADEFWLPASRNLKTEIESSEFNTLQVRRYYMVPCSGQTGNPQYRFWHNVIKTVNPIPIVPSPTGPEVELTESLMVHPCGPKVMCRTTGLHSIGHGNHTADIEGQRLKSSEDVRIYHYPIRTWEQFYRKVVNHGTSYAANNTLGPGVSWHLRRWYRILQEGRLEAEYALQLLDRERLARHMSSGVVEPDFTLLAMAETGVFRPGSQPCDINRLAARLHLPEPKSFQLSVLSGEEYGVLSMSDYKPHTIIDAGANVGAASVLLANKYPEARIYAFEPSSRNFEVLARNTVALKQVRAFQVGLSDQDGEAELFLGGTGLTDGLYPNQNSTTRTEIVPMRSAARLLAEIGCLPISILKLDTEGCEVAILRDLSAHLGDIDYICLEYHSENDRREIDNLLGQTHLLVHAKCDHAQRGTLGFLNRTMAAFRGLAGNEIRREAAINGGRQRPCQGAP
jgi:FkbM family methyltransferase